MIGRAPASLTLGTRRICSMRPASRRSGGVPGFVQRRAAQHDGKVLRLRESLGDHLQYFVAGTKLPLVHPRLQSRLGKSGRDLACGRPVFTRVADEYLRHGRSCPASFWCSDSYSAPATIVDARSLLHDDSRADRHAIVEIDDILIAHAEAAGGHRLPDRLRLVRAVDAVQA